MGELGSKFKKYVTEHHCENNAMNVVQAAEFLQHQGRVRTALQRKKELKDIDLNQDGEISFLEYLLLHYKVMILQEYYKRTETPVPASMDFSNHGVGIVGVGEQLLEELCTFPVGMDPAIEEAIEEFMTLKKERETKVQNLETKAAKGGVRGLAAKNELAQLAAGDNTENNRVEITLNAAKRRASKYSAEAHLSAKKQKNDESIALKRKNSRAALKARAALFEKN